MALLFYFFIMAVWSFFFTTFTTELQSGCLVWPIKFQQTLRLRIDLNLNSLVWSVVMMQIKLQPLVWN